MFESCWAHHSTQNAFPSGNAFFAHGEPFDQNGEPCDESNALLALSVVEGSERSESKGHGEPSEGFDWSKGLPPPLFTLVHGRWHRRLVWFLYIVRCSNGSLYVGETNDVVQRIADHNRGRGSAFTAKYRPVELAYLEQHPNRADCLQRERQIKGWTRVKKEALIAGDALALKKL